MRFFRNLKVMLGYKSQIAEENRLSEKITEIDKISIIENKNAFINNKNYRTPIELTKIETSIKKALIIGSCFSENILKYINSYDPEGKFDHILINNISELSDDPPQNINEYDFQFLQIPIRSFFNEEIYFSLDFSDERSFKSLYDYCCKKLEDRLNSWMKWNIRHGITTFISNFFVPQQNPLGRLLPRYKYRNLSYFVEQLNLKLISLAETFSNTYIIDVDQISSNIGKRYIQDDSTLVIGHGSLINDGDFEFDQDRISSINPLTQYYESKTDQFNAMVWQEIIATYRTIMQTDMVKMVIVDLDDTLWRGVIAETGYTNTEGWPLGFLEALMFLKNRGILLGIVSKNTEEVILNNWPYKKLFPIENFAIRRINWNPKPENIQEILAEANLLPESVVYIDDNPVEREAVAQFFPAIRLLGANPYLLRRILLWAPETQVATITKESSQRTETIRSKILRENERQNFSREDFIKSLNIESRITQVNSLTDTSYQRCLELINKTNQFNTNGKRWSPSEATDYLNNGGSFYALHVADNYTNYGLVGVLCVKANHIDQFVMSCRVFGLDVELSAVITTLKDIEQKGFRTATASFTDTTANLPARNIWSKTGFHSTENGFEYLFSK